MAIASLVLGIVSLVFACVSFSVILGWLSIVALVMGIVGIVLAGVAKSKGKSGSATAGLALSILSTIFSFVPGILWIIVIMAAAGAVTAL